MTGWQGAAQLQVEGSDMAAITQLAGRIQTLSIANVRHGLSREAREKVEAETTAQAIARFRDRAQAQAQLFGFTGFAIREVSVGTDGSQPPVPFRIPPGLRFVRVDVKSGRPTVRERFQNLQATAVGARESS